MTNTQVFFASITVAISFIGALWAISNSTTTRLIEQFEKRMNERDENLLAKLETLEAKLETLDTKMTGKFDALGARLDTLQFQITTLDKKFDGELRRELDQLNQRLNRLERAA